MNEIPFTLTKLLTNAEKDQDNKRIEGIRDTIGLLDEWLDYFTKRVKEMGPLGTKTLDEAEFINHMRMGLKRFRGKSDTEY